MKFLDARPDDFRRYRHFGCDNTNLVQKGNGSALHHNPDSNAISGSLPEGWVLLPWTPHSTAR